MRVDQEHRVRGEQVEDVRGDVVGYLDRLLALPVACWSGRDDQEESRFEKIVTRKS